MSKLLKCGLAALLIGVLVAPSAYGFQWIRPIARSLADMSFEHNERGPHILFQVRNLLQKGDVANCGPTAAAMMISAYRNSVDDTRLESLRDEMGLWSWERYPMRAWRLPGGRAGMTTPKMLLALLQKFGGDLTFDDLRHPFLPSESYSLLALQQAVENGRPVIILVESSMLWGTARPGLHWIVVTGVSAEGFIFNDPGDGKRWEISVEKLWRAWRLNGFFRRLPGLDAFHAWASHSALGVPALREGPTLSYGGYAEESVPWYEPR